MSDAARREFSVLVARLVTAPRQQRPVVLTRLLPFLGEDGIPLPARIAAAARALTALPDRDRPIRRIARALTRGLSRTKGLERLRQLQHRVEACDALDRLIEARERRLRLSCPRCQTRLPRVEMVKHLWHEHRLVLENGKARSLMRVLSGLQDEQSTTGASEPLDRVAALAGIEGLRRWLANDELPAEEILPLLRQAGDHGAGLCPACFAELPGAVTALPVPLVLSRGRLAGEGFAIEVGGNAWFRTLCITAAGKSSIGRSSLAPRAVATLGAAVVLAATVVFAATFSAALTGIVLAAITYVLARIVCLPSRSDNDRVVDAAWSRLAPSLVEQPDAARFLARLCLASHDRGDPEERAAILRAVAQRAVGRAETSDEELQLLAAVHVLQVEDMSRLGRDVTAGIASLAADGFAGVLPADYAELVVASYLSRSREHGELERLRILLLEAAFNAGLGPRDLIHLWAGSPNLKRVMAVEPAHRLGILFGIWRTREARSWESVAPAVSVFTLARTSPPTSARLLGSHPDLLLACYPAGEVERELGPILICARGVSIGGALIADPDAAVRLTDDGKQLVFGRHGIDVSRRLPPELPSMISKWLRYRADVLMPFVEESLAAGSDEVARRVRGPFCRRCLTCGTISAVSAGAIGQAIPT